MNGRDGAALRTDPADGFRSAAIQRSPTPVWGILSVTLFHVIALTVGFLILIAVFQFPDILRSSAVDRLQAFVDGAATIVPAYYLLALTGLSQAALAVLLWLAAPRRDEAVLVLAGMFGVLCGAFQVIGFIRWPIVIPYVAEAMAAAGTADAQATVALMEGLLNRYAGMAIGEHLGFLGMGLWTLLLGFAIRIQPFVDRRLGLVGIILGAATLAMGMEPLGGVFTTWGELTPGVFGFWTTWLVLVSISVIRGRKGDTSRTVVPWPYWAIGLAYAIAASAPSYVG